MLQNSENLNCDKTQKLKQFYNTNLNYDSTQMRATLQNLNCDNTQKPGMSPKWKSQIVSKLKLCQNSKGFSYTERLCIFFE